MKFETASWHSLDYFWAQGHYLSILHQPLIRLFLLAKPCHHYGEEFSWRWDFLLCSSSHRYAHIIIGIVLHQLVFLCEEVWLLPYTHAPSSFISSSGDSSSHWSVSHPHRCGRSVTFSNPNSSTHLIFPYIVSRSDTSMSLAHIAMSLGDTKLVNSHAIKWNAFKFSLFCDFEPTV